MYLQGVSGEPFCSGSQASCSLALPHSTPFPTFVTPSMLLVSIAPVAPDSWLSELLGPPVTKNCCEVASKFEEDVVVVEVRIGVGVTAGTGDMDCFIFLLSNCDDSVKIKFYVSRGAKKKVFGLKFGD